MKNLFCILMLLLGLRPLLAAPEKALLTGKIAPSGRQGIVISNQDFVISNGSRVCFTTRGWTKVYLRSVPHPNRPPVKVETFPGGAKESIAPADSSGGVHVEEYSVRCEGNRADILLRASAPDSTRQEIVIEHVALVLRAGLLQGATYEITEANGNIAQGVIPMVQKDKSRKGLLPPFTKGIFRSALGTVTIQVLEGTPLKLDDRRAAIFEGLGPSFIAWCDSCPFNADGRFAQKITLTFDYPGGAAAKAVTVNSIPRNDEPRPAVPESEFPLLPLPTNMKFTGGDYVPQPTSVLVLHGGSPLLLKHARKLAAAWGMTAVSGPVSPDTPCLINVGADVKNESYSLQVTAKGIRVEAAGERAAFYALQTLRGLYRMGRFRGADISDHPAFAIRAVHAMADSDTLNHLAPILTDVLAPMKINTLFLECPYVTWDTLAGMHHPKGMPKEDLVKLLAIAKENYITVYPLLPTYSHSEWFFQNGKNLEMIDNPADLTAYNSLHPGVHPFLEKLFDEVLETFGNPDYVHISHDEVARNHPVKPEGKAKGIKQLFKDDVLWHYEFFRKRGIKVMLWHDMLVSRAEAGPRADANARGGTEQLRKELPKELTICVWNYNVPRENPFPEVKAVVEDHFPIIGAGWYTEGNLEGLTRTCQKANALGMMVTTWHWKFDSAGLLYTQYGQIHSYVRAAALFWNPDAGIGDKAPQVLVDLLRKPEKKTGTLAFIPLEGNTLLASEAPEFSQLKGTQVRTPDELPFQLLRNKHEELAAVCINSRRLPHLPTKVRIPLHHNCNRLHLLQTLLNRGMRNEGVSAKLVFRYKDGSYEAIYPRNGVDVAYGQVPVFHNDGKPTFRPDEIGCTYDQPSFQRNQWNALTWQDPKGDICRIWSYTWENPHPEKELDHLLLETQDPSTTYCLLALTSETL